MASALGEKLRLLADVYLRSGGTLSGRYEATAIELTSFCNLSCPLCPVARDANTLNRERKTIDPGDLHRIIELTKDITRTYVLSMWGEPLLHKDFFPLLDVVRAACGTIWISTNLNYSAKLAHRLAECPELKIICSLDGWDEDSYKVYRVGGRFDLVVQNLAILTAGRCGVYPQFLINDDNRDQVGAMHAFCEGFGLGPGDILLRPMAENFRNENVGTVPGTCHAPYRGLHFNSDGYLLPCAVNVGPDLRIQHISEIKSAEELLNGEPMRAMRRQLAKDKNHYESCQSCAGVRVDAVLAQSVKTRIRNFLTPGSSGAP